MNTLPYRDSAPPNLGQLTSQDESSNGESSPTTCGLKSPVDTMLGPLSDGGRPRDSSAPDFFSNGLPTVNSSYTEYDEFNDPNYTTNIDFESVNNFNDPITEFTDLNDPHSEAQSHYSPNPSSLSPLSEAQSRPSRSPSTFDPQSEVEVQSHGSPSPPPSEYGSLNQTWEEENIPKYELRPQTIEDRSRISSTWMDQDETNDYDPAEERRMLNPYRPRRNRPRKEIDSAKGTSDEGISKKARIPDEPMSLIVELRINSERSRDALLNILSEPSLGCGLSIASFSVGEHRLRRRACTASNRLDSTAPSILPDIDQDSSSDLTGHPLARGCWHCALSGDDCSLLVDERTWPCDPCQKAKKKDATHECDLIRQPVYKNSCERCKKRNKWACSFTETNDHAGPCRSCQEDGFRCIAGPMKDRIPARIRYDRDWVNDPIRVRKPPNVKLYWTCNNCNKAGQQCSFHFNHDVDTCTACDMGGKTCTKQQVPKSQLNLPKPKTAAEPQKQSKPVDKQDRKRKDHPTQQQQPEPKRAKSTRAALQDTPTRIRTRFCHPMAFNHVPTDFDDQCDFCDGSSFSFFGQGERDVEIIDPSTGGGYQELKGGHAAEGKDTTKMCPSCTNERVPIVKCKNHKLRPIRGLVAAKLDNVGALAALEGGMPRGKDRWCSICPSLALYECAAEKFTPGFHGRPLSTGCGLALCGLCAGLLARRFGGKFQEMLKDLKDERSEKRPLGLRADFELLKKGGLLMRAIPSEKREKK